MLQGRICPSFHQHSVSTFLVDAIILTTSLLGQFMSHKSRRRKKMESSIHQLHWLCRKYFQFISSLKGEDCRISLNTDGEYDEVLTFRERFMQSYWVPNKNVENKQINRDQDTYHRHYELKTTTPIPYSNFTIFKTYNVWEQDRYMICRWCTLLLKRSPNPRMSIIF